jgi:acetyl esterase/lipase
MISKQTFVYKTAGDALLQADVYRVPDQAARPAIVWIHGGALIIGDRQTLPSYQAQRYVQAGYTVISIDYRLAPETKLESIIGDLRDAYRWVVESGSDLLEIDADRIAVVGHSAGGYLTLMSGFCVRPRPKALVSFYGYGDIVGPWYSRPDPHYCQEPTVTKEEAYQAIGAAVPTGTPFEGELCDWRWQFYLYCRQQGLWPKLVAGHDPDKEPRWFDSYCPVRNVTSDYPPTLLIHGDQDTDVPFEQSVLMAEELARHHVEHQLIRLHQGHHGFDMEPDAPEDATVADVFGQVLAFLGRNCGGEDPHRF